MDGVKRCKTSDFCTKGYQALPFWAGVWAYQRQTKTARLKVSGPGCSQDISHPTAKMEEKKQICVVVDIAALPLLLFLLLLLGLLLLLLYTVIIKLVAVIVVVTLVGFVAGGGPPSATNAQLTMLDQLTIGIGSG